MCHKQKHYFSCHIYMLPKQSYFPYIFRFQIQIHLEIKEIYMINLVRTKVETPLAIIIMQKHFKGKLLSLYMLEKLQWGLDIFLKYYFKVISLSFGIILHYLLNEKCILNIEVKTFTTYKGHFKTSLKNLNGLFEVNVIYLLFLVSFDRYNISSSLKNVFNN